MTVDSMGNNREYKYMKYSEKFYDIKQQFDAKHEELDKTEASDEEAHMEYLLKKDELNIIK